MSTRTFVASSSFAAALAVALGVGCGGDKGGGATSATASTKSSAKPSTSASSAPSASASTSAAASGSASADSKCKQAALAMRKIKHPDENPPDSTKVDYDASACEKDKWSEKQIDCFIGAKDKAAVEACEKMK